MHTCSPSMNVCMCVCTHVSVHVWGGCSCASRQEQNARGCWGCVECVCMLVCPCASVHVSLQPCTGVLYIHHTPTHMLTHAATLMERLSEPCDDPLVTLEVCTAALQHMHTHSATWVSFSRAPHTLLGETWQHARTHVMKVFALCHDMLGCARERICARACACAVYGVGGGGDETRGFSYPCIHYLRDCTSTIMHAHTRTHTHTQAPLAWTVCGSWPRSPWPEWQRPRARSWRHGWRGWLRWAHTDACMHTCTRTHAHTRACMHSHSCVRTVAILLCNDEYTWHATKGRNCHYLFLPHRCQGC